MNESFRANDENRARLVRALAALKDLRSQVDAFKRERSEPIAVVGLGCRYPGGIDDADSFWRLLRDRQDAIREVPADRSDDELTWMEIAALAAEHDVTVYDWLVLSDRWAFSVAEFAPVPAQW